jgi:hypothetical protein
MSNDVKYRDQGMSRGQFLAGAVGAGGAAVASGLLPGAARAAKTPPRTYTAGRFALELDGAASELQSATDSGQSGLVIEEPLAPGAVIAKKHIANVKWCECTVAAGMGLDKGFYNWIQQSFDKSFARKSGSVVAADFDYNELSRLNFQDGVITELTMPALDAGSKDAAKLLVTIGSSSFDHAAGRYPLNAKHQKMWSPANFRLSIDGVDTRRVSKIDSFTIKQSITEDAKGVKVPGKIEIPDLSISIADEDAGSITAWLEDFIVNGHNGEDFERGGKLEYLAPDNRTVLATLSLTRVGIFKGTAEPSENNSDKLRAARIGFRIYCEDAKLTF